MDLYRELGRVVKRVRTERGLTQQQLAEQVGLNRVSIANIEGGNHHPPFHYVIRLADVLGFDMNEIMSVYRKQRLDSELKKHSKELGVNLRAILAEKGKHLESTSETG